MCDGCDCEITYGPRPRNYAAEARASAARRLAKKKSACLKLSEDFNNAQDLKERIGILKQDIITGTFPTSWMHFPPLYFSDLGAVYSDRKIQAERISSQKYADLYFKIQGSNLVIMKHQGEGQYSDENCFPIMSLSFSVEEKKEEEATKFIVFVSSDPQYHSKASLDAASL